MTEKTTEFDKTNNPVKTEYDPRTKLLIVMCITSLAVFFSDLAWMAGVLVVALSVSMYFKSHVVRVISKLKKFIWVFIVMVFIQSIFTGGGRGLVQIGDFTAISTIGLYNGVSIILRMLIIIISATIMGTSNSRDIVQGLYQWKIPYELAFMVAVAIRFLPILRDEAIDMLTAIQLRGLDLKKIPFGKKIKVYSYLVMPMIASVLGKARELAVAIEMRGFRACSCRTSYRNLKLTPKDYTVVVSTILLTGTAVFLYYIFKRQV